MKRHKENSFTKKFNLLNSQEHNEDIRWSSSDSSDYENVNNKINHSHTTFSNHKKRKRKKKVQKSVSNLSFSLVKVTKDDKKIYPDKSPIINGLFLETKQRAEKSSPILSSKVITGDVKREDRSPVLLLKRQSSVVMPTTKKRLFVTNDGSELHKTGVKNITSKELKQSNNGNDKIVTKTIRSISHTNNNYAGNSYANKNCESLKIQNESENKINSNKIYDSNVLATNNKVEKANEASKPRMKIDLVQKIQSYFDSQFGSDSGSPSQQSISESETLTQKSDAKASGDLEINSSFMQNKDNSPLPVQESSSVVSHGNWDVNLIVEKSKKNKYKKDGLAYRLDQLLKKQNANISLWQHEKFLARNSNFIIPKSKHIVFRIQKINFKYGCYLLEAVDLSDERHFIFINGYYINSPFNLAPDVVLKLYMPYKILDLSNQYKIVINVCKFECVPIVS